MYIVSIYYQKTMHIMCQVSLVVKFTTQQENNRGADQTARMRRLVCSFAVRNPRREVFRLVLDHIHLLFMFEWRSLVDRFRSALYTYWVPARNWCNINCLLRIFFNNDMYYNMKQIVHRCWPNSHFLTQSIYYPHRRTGLMKCSFSHYQDDQT